MISLQTGGVVTDGMPTSTHHGTPLTFLGASVLCHGCKTVGHIAPKGPRWPHSMHGKEQALDGDICICKCVPPPVMIASQHDSYQSFETHELSDMGHAGGGALSMTVQYRGNYDERVRVLNESGQPIPSIPYHIKTSTGAVYKGLTDVSGYCPRVYTDDVSKLDIAIGMQALERWDA
ncbi:PAAR domain-containing protein [Burkholderia aenigmatica]|uniref:PAAR domain-containing protein n=1 Tax=Burkholderia aenigmatica TaxID=2015348 RepID=UPI003454CF97